jgi:hypothetical protein
LLEKDERSRLLAEELWMAELSIEKGDITTRRVDRGRGKSSKRRPREVTLSMKREGQKKVVFLPADLYSRVAERAEAAGFGSVDEYVEFVLEELIKEEEGDAVPTEVEEKEVKKRLRDLGYLG